MPSLSPSVTLVLLLSVAVAVFMAGSRLASRKEQVHVPGDRRTLESLAGGIEQELRRQERLYEKRLRQLAVATSSQPADRQAISDQCKRIAGVTQWSLVHSSGGPADIHVAADPDRSNVLPEPTLFTDSKVSPRSQLLLSGSELFDSENESWGWINDPGQFLIFWKRTAGNAAVVLLIDPDSVRAALDPSIAQQAADAFSRLQESGTAAFRLESAGAILASTATEAVGAPDFLLPLRSPFGFWKLFSWDPIETHIRYDRATQGVSGAIAAAVATLGVVVFLQQRSMLAQASQRVTFVNRVSHELRTPLTNIMLNLDLIAETIEEAGEEPARRLALVQDEARRLGRLIENVLTFSRAERGRLKFQPRASVPDDIIESAVQHFDASFARRSLAVRRVAKASRVCLLDPDALAQILSNLFSNVEKYVPGGVVEVSSLMDGDVLVVRVTDEGPGIPSRDAARIFRPFERLDSRIHEGASGTGLGLTIARDLAEGMGGSLDILPSVSGASFELRCPSPPVPGHNSIFLA